MSTKYLKFLILCVIGGMPPLQSVDVPTGSRIQFLKPLTKLGMRIAGARQCQKFWIG